jgi:TonB dependent receptor/Carboxypeptidase regulatory-like domain/TonB-dependent Receptor Plug Domain
MPTDSGTMCPMKSVSFDMVGIRGGWRLQRGCFFAAVVLVCLLASGGGIRGAETETADITGKVSDPQGLVVPQARITLSRADGAGVQEIETDAQGAFTFRAVVAGTYTITGRAGAFKQVSKTFEAVAGGTNLVEMKFGQVAAGHDSVVIVSSAVDPAIDLRNGDVYKKTLFERDDQMLESLGAGINAGQHEGGGKSLEIRRFGFNLDHGGVNGGLKVVVNDLPQNQGSQGHGQGYLGALKALTPELVDNVAILNGPFSAEYGDFSGLGVVQIRTRESLPDELTWRTQAGSFDTYRTFLAYSPSPDMADAFVSYEGAYTNGPFINHGRYARNNFTGNYTWHLGEGQDFGVKGNFGTNYFYSSGQIPLDLVAAGELDRFGFIDPTDGGGVRLGTAAAYYRKKIGAEDSFKVDGFFGRSLFDLYSNFTFFLNDPVHGDGIQQHDSRAQEGVNTQYQHFYKIGEAQALLTVGTNFHANEIKVGLLAREGRVAYATDSESFLFVPNYAGYAQQSLDLLKGRLHLEGGLRWDYFSWRDDDRVTPSISGTESGKKIQPKAAAAWTPTSRLPVIVSFNYGRGINTQDARGIVERPDAPRIATTDFYQAGVAYNRARFGISVDSFLIDRSNEQVYIPDDGTFEFKGPSRSYGYEGKASVRLTRYLALNGGLTQVTQSFFQGTFPRVYVDSAPHNVEDAGFTLSGWHGVFGSLRWRHVGNYRLDGLDAGIRASGLDAVDLAVTKQIRRWVEVNLDIDNLTDKQYYETQNYLESRVTPTAPVVARIHGTPAYPIGATGGVTFHFWAKKQ